MPSEAVVVDACVLGALIFQEPQAEEAAGLLKGKNLHAPPLAAYELTNTALKKINKYPKEKTIILKALAIGLNMNIRWVAVDHLAVCRLAFENSLTAYDASYLYLARACKIKLITFDKRLQAVIGP